MDSGLTIDSTRDGRVLLLTLDRPDTRNALNEAGITQLTHAFASVARDPNVRAVVLTGAGEMFCSGTDIAWIESLASGAADSDARLFGNLLSQIRSCPKPVLAKINGPAIGAGAGIVAATDVAIAQTSATFSFPAVHLGIVPAAIAPFLSEAMGPRVARHLLLTGETISAERAQHLGLVQATGIGADVDAITDQMLTQICNAGPSAIQETKALLNTISGAAPDAGLINKAAKLSARVRRRSEAREGLRAYVEGREPSWRALSDP